MSVISLKLKNISARIPPPPFFSPFFSKEDIKQLLLKKFFHYNVSHDAILATRSYKIDSFSIVNFPLIINPRFVFSFYFPIPVQIRVSQDSPNSKIHHHRRHELKIPPATGPIKRKMNETLECLNSKAELWRIKRERERENSSTWSLRPKFSFHVRFWPIVAAMHLPNVSPPPAAKIVEHEYLAFGRKISPWTCTINDPPLFLLNRWIRTPLSIRRRVGESELPLELFSRGKTPRKWILERGEEGEKGVDKCKTRCRKRSNRFRTFLVILYLVKFRDIKSCDISSLTNVTFEASTRFDRYLARAIRLFPSRGIRD